MALHKMWLSDQSKRNPLKRSKDRAQGELLARTLPVHMPQFSLDTPFWSAVPAELKGYQMRFSGAR